jgi:hypothetical protein
MYEFFADSIGGKFIMVGGCSRLFDIGWRIVEGIEVSRKGGLLLLLIHL